MSLGKTVTHLGNRDKPRRPNWLRGRLAKWPLLPYRLGLGFLIAQKVLILTTEGRITGRARRTPLWYVRQGDTVYCLSGWGPSSRWWKNLEANPQALVQMGNKAWETHGMIIPEPEDIERVSGMFLEKYGRLTRLFYHLDRLSLVAFKLGGPAAQPDAKGSVSQGGS